jgi:hypothetical protein
VLNALGRSGPANPKFEPDCAALTPPEQPSEPGGPGGEHPQPAGPGRLAIGGARLHGRRLRVALKAHGLAVRHVVVRLRAHNGTPLGRSQPRTVRGHRVVVRITPRAALLHGKRYRLSARGRSTGKRVTARKRFRLR